MLQSAPRKALIALTILAGGALLDPGPAQARRFGGGRSISMSRDIHVHSTPAPRSSSASPIDRAPYPIEHAPLTSSRASARDSSNFLPDAGSAFLLRARLDAIQRRNAARENEAFARTGSRAPAAAMETSAPSTHDTSFRSGTGRSDIPTEYTSRPADPRFARLTDNQPAPTAACEFKPVMSDADYIACGATPPQFSSPR